MRCLARIVIVLSFSWALIYPVQRLDATTVRQLTLEEMIKAADRIFVGKCLSVESRRDERGVPATYATFQVIERIKGKLGDTITIKQFGGAPPGVLKIPGMPTYQAGEKVLLFLHPPSQYGFTSPVGLQQGKWAIMETSSGKKLLKRRVPGGLALKGSPGALYGLTPREGLFHYSRFISLLKRMVGQ